jgi:hypothetical protein
MGAGCKCCPIHTDHTDVVVGTWNDNRVGTFRGTRSGKANMAALSMERLA